MKGWRREDKLVRALQHTEGSWKVCCQQAVSEAQAVIAAACQCVFGCQSAGSRRCVATGSMRLLLYTSGLEGGT